MCMFNIDAKPDNQKYYTVDFELERYFPILFLSEIYIGFLSLLSTCVKYCTILLALNWNDIPIISYQRYRVPFHVYVRSHDCMFH